MSVTKTRMQREAIANGYVQMVTDRLAMGWKAYLLTFTYNELLGTPQEVARAMECEVERVYAQILTRIVRKPNTAAGEWIRPVWIVAHDLPVFKRDKDHYRDVAPNGGRHLHAIAIVPPRSRLKGSLAGHIDEQQGHYAGSQFALWRVHAAAIESQPEYVLKYALKAFINGLIDDLSLFVLPRTKDEVK